VNDKAPTTGADDFVERLVAHLDESADSTEASAGEAARDEPDGLVFAAVTAELRAAATWAGPPAGLRESILARVRTAPTAASAQPVADAPEPTPEPTPEPVEAPPQRSRRATSRRAWQAAGRAWQATWRARWGRLGATVAASALAAAVFTAGVLAIDRALQPAPAPHAVYTATGTTLAPQATAKVAVASTGSGFSVAVTADGLPAAAPGSFYAAWLRGPHGTVPLGSFHQRRSGTPITLWSGVDPADYPTFEVTLQAEGDPTAPSTLVVMTATLHR
jgi:hypothetical protein